MKAISNSMQYVAQLKMKIGWNFYDYANTTGSVHSGSQFEKFHSITGAGTGT